MLKKFFAIIAETYREAIARKTIVGFFIFSTVVVIITMFFFLNPTVRDSMMKMKQFSGSGAKSNIATDIIMVKAIDIFWTVVLVTLNFITICLGVFSTTGFITSQMEKGTIDLLISKPVPRWLYIAGRYCASLSIILLQVIWFIFGIWIVVSTTMGTWQPNFLWSIFFITLGFAGIYSIVVLISVISGSSALSIIAGIGLFFISLLVAGGRGIENAVQTSSKSVLSYIGDVLYYILPQTGDMSTNMKNLILGEPMSWLPVLMIMGLTAIYLSLSIVIFNKKEF